MSEIWPAEKQIVHVEPSLPGMVSEKLPHLNNSEQTTSTHGIQFDVEIEYFAPDSIGNSFNGIVARKSGRLPLMPKFTHDQFTKRAK